MPEIKLSDLQRREALTVFPLLQGDAPDLPYRLLADALEAGTIRIGEVGSGSVPELMVENKGDADVLILDGEQLIGAKQNRMTSRTIIVAEHTTTTVPVSCMEHGRWHFTSDAFSHARRNSPSRVRRHARKAEAMRAAVGAPADHRVLAEAQGSVWAEIAEYEAKLGARSDTGALDHLYMARSFDLDEWLKGFPLVPGQVGLLAFMGDEPLGLDLIGAPKLYERLHARILSGYVMDAFAARAEPRSTAPGEPKSEIKREAAQAFLDKVRAAPRSDAPTVGRGTYRVLSGAVMGGELEDRGGVAHLCAFPADEPRARDDRTCQGIAGPISRRRRVVY